MSLPNKRTLGELRQELRDRLGFASLGAKSGPNTSIIDSFLRNAQVQLYWQFDWKFLTEVDKTTQTNQGQTAYDWPDDVDPDRVISVVVKDTSSTTINIYPLVEGIDTGHDNFVTPESHPRRFERRGNIEIWPSPDSNSYFIWIEHVKRLGRFTQDNDRATLDEDLIFLHALSNSKSHYGHPDADIYIQQLNALMQRLKSKGMGNKRYSRLPMKEDVPQQHVHLDDI